MCFLRSLRSIFEGMCWSEYGAAHYVNTEITLKWVHKGLLVGPFGNLLEYGFKAQR